MAVAVNGPATGQSQGAVSGAGTFAALTDKATADLPSINGPLATALAAAATGSAGPAFAAVQGFARPHNMSAFEASASSQPTRVLLMGTSIASFDNAAVQRAATELVRKYGRSGTVQQLGAYGGNYGAQGGYQKQPFGGSGYYRLVVAAGNPVLTLTGYGDRCILVYSKDGGSTTTAAVNGGAGQTVDSSGSQAYSQELIFDTAAEGLMTLVVQPPASGQVFLERVEFIRSKVPGIVVENATLGGAGLGNTATLMSTGTGNLAGIAISGNNGIDSFTNRPTSATKPALVICEHFTNDGAATFVPLLNRMLTNLAAADTPAILLTEQPAIPFISAGGVLNADKTSIRSAIVGAAAAYSNVAVVDWAGMVDFSNPTAYEAKYYEAGEQTHPKTLGQNIPLNPLLRLLGLEASEALATSVSSRAESLRAAGAIVSTDAVETVPLPVGLAKRLPILGTLRQATVIGQALDLAANVFNPLFAAPEGLDLLNVGFSNNATIAASGLSDQFGRYIAGAAARSKASLAHYQPADGGYLTFVVLARRVTTGFASWGVADDSSPGANAPRICIGSAITSQTTVGDSRALDAVPMHFVFRVKCDAAISAQQVNFNVPSQYRVYALYATAGQAPILPLRPFGASPLIGPPLFLPSELTAAQVLPGQVYVENAGGTLLQKRATTQLCTKVLQSGLVVPVYELLNRSDAVFRLTTLSASGGTVAYSVEDGGHVLSGYSGGAICAVGGWSPFPWGQTFTVLFRAGRLAPPKFARLQLFNGGTNGEANLTSAGTWQAGLANLSVGAYESAAITFTFPASGDFPSLGSTPDVYLYVPGGGQAYATFTRGFSACV